MKKTFLLILILLGLRSMAMAQGIQPIDAGDLVLNLNFSPVSGSPGTNQPSGTANYYYYPGPVIGNFFSISIFLGPNPATDGWLFQKNDDGSYTPIMEFTNTDRDYSYRLSTNSFPPVLIPVATNYVFAQNWQLTTDQVQTLVAGKWYAEVSYGSDEYWANLSPTYIQSPSPLITISPDSVFPSPSVIVFPGGNATGAVISPAFNEPARVTLNGTNSSDAFYLPLQFLWRNGPEPIADTAMPTLRLMPGNYAFTLEVSDGYNTNSAMAMVDVLSPEEAIEDLSSATAQAGLNSETTRRLILTLQQAQFSLQRGDIFSGTRKLAMFRQDIDSLASQMYSPTAFYLYDGAQEIIDAVGDQPDGYQRHPF